MSAKLRDDQAKVVIIGAGAAGLTMGIRLKNKLKFDNFVIYEKAGDIGGTWRDNNYPGCQCDVASHVYCLSTDPKPDWSAYYATQPEILQYWRDLATKYDLLPHLVFNTSVKDAEWDSNTNEYRVVVEDISKGEEKELKAHVVVSAIGYISFARMPKDLPGMETFAGPSFHSSQWRHDVDLHEKRVGVIGLGSSATQIVPAISKDPTVQVINFWRTPAWLAAPITPNHTYSSFHKWLFANLPGYYKIYRFLQLAKLEPLVFTTSKDNKFIVALVRKVMAARIMKDAPKEYAKELIPDYPFGCRRFVVDNDYSASLHRPNVSLMKNVIDSIVPEGIRTKNGEIIPLDVIVYATGFQAIKTIVDVKGREGLKMSKFSETQGGPTAYMGMVYPGYPNYFSVLGPNSIAGHISNVLIIERQVDYIVQLLEPILTRKAKAVEVTPAAHKEWNTWIDKSLSNSVFLDCHSYFRDQGTGKIDVIYPGSTPRLIWQTRSPRWRDFVVTGGKNWVRSRQSYSMMRLILGTTALLIALGLTTQNYKSNILEVLRLIRSKVPSLQYLFS